MVPKIIVVNQNLVSRASISSRETGSGDSSATTKAFHQQHQQVREDHKDFNDGIPVMILQ